MSAPAPDCHRRLRAEPEWFPRADGLERAVVFQPGYNCPVPGGKGHGVHGMEIIWRLRGPKGDVWLRVYTTWTPGELYPGHGMAPAGRPRREAEQHPMGAGLGYHCRVPQFDGQAADGPCPDFGAECYSDASYTAADEVAQRFTEDGEPAVWAALEAEYAGLRAPEGAS